MRALPEQFEADALIASLADGWHFDVAESHYAPVGGGSYHWVVIGGDGTRGFVTVDDLDRKPWLGDTRESVFDGLRRAFDTALALRGSGLRFVVAPIPTSRRETVRRIGSRYTIALFPFVDGQVGRFGEYDTGERAAVLTMLAELRRATPAVAAVAHRIDLKLPGRRELESALRDVNETWSGGPFSEPTRQALARHASAVVELLALADRLAAEVARSTNWVVTHGEPHAANMLRTDESYVLIDWDTVALAPPERDLWMVVDNAANEVDQVAVDYFRLRWDLTDLAAFTNVLRSPHRKSADTVKAYAGLTKCVGIRDQWAVLLARAHVS